jgi:coniferyl-aldehyde dehydrogenase
MNASTPHAQCAAGFARQQAASRAQPEVPLALRRDRLRRLQALVEQQGSRLADAVQADFGVRSHDVTQLTELLPLQWELRHTLRHLARWMRTRRVPTPLQLQPAGARLQPQPLGVVGVVSPWTYPLNLALGPAVAALSAGNRVMLKPSEATPHTADCLAELLAERFDADELQVVTGDASVAAAFTAQPWDHLLFTGSPGVGRKVALAAAAQLVPTTLELGGKSPCLLDTGVDLAVAMPRIVQGKLLNCGQTCIAPDYVLLPRGQQQAFVQAFGATLQRFYPRIAGNPDYTALLDAGGLARMQALLDDARAKGGRVLQFGTAEPVPTDPVRQRQMPPALVLDTRPDMRVLREEIFGPILPLVPYDTLDEAIDFVNARERPLALYWFGQDAGRTARVLAQTTSGGVVLNDTLLHFVHSGLPFGGVGQSGWGAYHGEAGFLRLSHLKPVLRQPRWGVGALVYPPYGDRLRRLLGWMARF